MEQGWFFIHPKRGNCHFRYVINGTHLFRRFVWSIILGAGIIGTIVLGTDYLKIDYLPITVIHTQYYPIVK